MNSTLVAYGADARFALPLSVSLRSLSRFHTDPVVVLHVDFDVVTRRAVQRAVPMLEIRWIEVPGADVDRFPSHPLGPAAFYRLLLPGLLPDADRILYIDADTMVAAPLDGLLDADLAGHALGAVQNLHAPFVSSADGLASWRHQELDPRLPYFNSGVLLIDAQRWRRLGVEHTVIETANRLHRVGLLPVADQDALNVEFAGEWAMLDARYNQHPAVYDDAGSHHHRLPAEELAALRDNPAIVHFIGRNKPWKATSVHPHTEAWRSLVSTEAFPKWEPERRSAVEKVTGRLRKAASVLRSG